MSRYVGFFGLALVGVCASTAILASSASAFPLPSVLPSQIEREWKGKNIGSMEIWSLKGSAIICISSTATGTVTSNTLGEFHIRFIECDMSGVGQCTSLGDSTAGEILMLGTWHTVIDVDSPELHASILFLPKEAHFSCSLLLELIKAGINGGLNCLITEPLSEKASHTFTCKSKEGHQEERKYFNDEGKEVTATLEVSLNGGAFESFALTLVGSLEFTSAVRIDD